MRALCARCCAPTGHGVELRLFIKYPNREVLNWSWVFPAEDDPGLLALEDTLAFWRKAGFERENPTASPETPPSA
jgi:hypothetical protein